MPTDEAASDPTAPRDRTPRLAVASGPEDPATPEALARLHAELAATRAELLATRDELIGTTRELGAALGRIRELEDELGAYEAAVRDIRGYTHTPLWAGFGLYVRLRRRIGSLRRRVLALRGR